MSDRVMSVDAIRHLLYPLGFLGSLFFGLRFILQWWRSEKAQKSLVDSTFWKISLIGNMLMGLHYFIQVHFILCFLQSFNGFLAIRNLQLQKNALKQDTHSGVHRSLNEKSLSPLQRLLAIALIALTCALAFALQLSLSGQLFDWVQSPHSHVHPHEVSLRWHLIGFLGACIFNLRFWLQWWHAEEHGASEFKSWFWWLSFVGSLILCSYGLAMRDPVTVISNALPLAGYIRNLVLLRRHSKQSLQKSETNL